jgi:hypothetical protein
MDARSVFVLFATSLLVDPVQIEASAQTLIDSPLEIRLGGLSSQYYFTEVVLVGRIESVTKWEIPAPPSTAQNIWSAVSYPLTKETMDSIPALFHTDSSYALSFNKHEHLPLKNIAFDKPNPGYRWHLVLPEPKGPFEVLPLKFRPDNWYVIRTAIGPVDGYHEYVIHFDMNMNMRPFKIFRSG